MKIVNYLEWCSKNELNPQKNSSKVLYSKFVQIKKIQNFIESALNKRQTEESEEVAAC